MGLQPANRRWSVRSLLVLLGFLVLCQILARTSLTAEPAPVPRRFIPAKGLVAYLEYEGLDAHADAWKASAAHGILVDGHAGSMMSELARQLLDRLFKEDPGLKLSGADIVAIHDHLMHRGFMVAVHQSGNDDLATTVVLRDVAPESVRDRIDRVLKAALGPQDNEKPPAPVRIRGRDVFELKDKPATKPLVEPNPPDPAFSAVPPAATAIEPPAPPSPPVVASAPAVAPAPTVAPASPGSLTPTPLLPPSAPPDRAGEIRPNTPLATSIPKFVSWWFEGNDLVLVMAPGSDSKFPSGPVAKKKPDPENTGYRSLVMDTIEGKEPNVTTSEAFVSAMAWDKDIQGFEPNGLLILDPGQGKSLLSGLITLVEEPAALSLPSAKYISPSDVPPQLILTDSPDVELPDLPVDPFAPEIDSKIKLASKAAPVKDMGKAPDFFDLLGIDGLKRMVVRWGFQGKALLTDVRVEAPAPRKGLMDCLVQPTFSRKHLSLIPRGARDFVVGSFDAFGSYARFKNLVNTMNPDLAKEIPLWERTICEAVGLRGPEALRQVGSSWSVFRLPSLDGNAPADAEPDLTEYAFVAEIDNSEAFAKLLDSIADRVNQQLVDLENGAVRDKGNKVADPPVLALERLKPPDRGYQFTSPARLVPWLSDVLKPTILVGKSIVAIGSNLERAREALSAEVPAGNRWSPEAEMQNALDSLPEKLTFLAVGDPRDSAWPTMFEQLPGEVQLLIGMLGGFSENQASVGGELLAALGIPRPGGFRVRIDPAQIPKADQVRRHLFSSVLAATVDDRGFRLIGREAFPLACMGGKASFKSTSKWSGIKGISRDVKLRLDLLGLGH